jgi:hypothetical protein
VRDAAQLLQPSKYSWSYFERVLFGGGLSMVLFAAYLMYTGETVPFLFLLSGALLSCFGLGVPSRGGGSSQDTHRQGHSHTNQTTLWLPVNGWKQQRSGKTWSYRREQ